MGSQTIVVFSESNDLIVTEDPSAIVVGGDERVLLVDPDATPDVISPTTQIQPAPITHLTEFVGPIMYVGTAPAGSVAADASWRIYKVVETDAHPLKVSAGVHVWADRASLTYVDG